MKTLGRLDGFLGGHMAPVVLCCVALGIAFPEVLSHLNGVTVGLFAFMTFSNSLGGGFRELAQVVRHPLPVAVIFGLLHVVMPSLPWAWGRCAFRTRRCLPSGWCWSMQCPPVWRPLCGWA